MTILESRSMPERVAAFAKLFSDPLFKEAIEMLHGERRGVDASWNAPEVTSVRLLSFRVGAETEIEKLLSLGKLAEKQSDIAPEPDWGAPIV